MLRIDYKRGCAAMGTRFEVFLCGSDAEHLEAVAAAVLEEIIRLDALLSRFKSESEITRINREAGRAPVRVDREMFALLARCEAFRLSTEGYFDVTATTEERRRVASSLDLNAEDCTVRFGDPRMRIDLGGIGKGYALDRGREIVLRFGVESALIHGGTSSILALGQAPKAGRWVIDIRHPLLPPGTAPVARLNLKDKAFSCSAVRHPDQPQSDIVNPLSGRLLDGNSACAVVAASATEAEVYSTALLAMGRERAARFLAAKHDADLNVRWFEPGVDVP